MSSTVFAISGIQLQDKNTKKIKITLDLMFYPFFLGIFAPAFLATLSAMATACFFGLPASISVLMSLPTDFLLFDLMSGM